MATLSFVLLFVALALGVLLVAMSGGAKGAGAQMQTQSRRGRKLALVGFVVALLGLGVTLPAAVLASFTDRETIAELGVELTPQEQRGRDLFGAQCKNCHALKAANAVAQVGPDLDALRPPARLVQDAIENGRARGNGAMAADLVTGADVNAVAAFVAKVAGR